MDSRARERSLPALLPIDKQGGANIRMFLDQTRRNGGFATLEIAKGVREKEKVESRKKKISESFRMIFFPVANGGAHRHVTWIGRFVAVDVALSCASFS